MSTLALFAALALAAPPITPQLAIDADSPHKVTKPINVRIDAATTSQIGKRYKVRVVVTGDRSGADPTWLIFTKVADYSFESQENGMVGDLTSTEPGVFVFIVGVSDADGKVVMTQHTLELSACPGSPSPMPEPAKSKEQPRASHDDEPSPEELISKLTEKVRSPTKKDDLAQVRSAVTIAASRVGSSAGGTGGVVTANFQTVRDQVFLSLGSDAARFAPWNSWLESLKKLYVELENQGNITDAASFAAALRSTAKVLETTR